MTLGGKKLASLTALHSVHTNPTILPFTYYSTDDLPRQAARWDAASMVVLHCSLYTLRKPHAVSKWTAKFF